MNGYHPGMEQAPRETVDESQDLDLRPIDFVLGFLTLPLLFWATLYAVTGHERLYATAAARMRLYLVLLAIEVVIVAAAIWWFVR